MASLMKSANPPSHLKYRLILLKKLRSASILLLLANTGLLFGQHAYMMPAQGPRLQKQSPGISLSLSLSHSPTSLGHFTSSSHLNCFSCKLIPFYAKIHADCHHNHLTKFSNKMRYFTIIKSKYISCHLMG